MGNGSNNGQADIVYTHGEVLLDAGETAEAILVRDGRVAAVGSSEEVLRAADPQTERLSLDGATVIPGLVDTHPHLLHFTTFKAPLVDLSQARNHDEIVEAIRRKAAQTPKGEWIRTTPVGEPHYFNRRSYRDLAEGALPDRHVLDRATSDHPVMIQAWAPVLPNICALNSAALAAVGIDPSTPDQVSHVWIEKDDQGAPTGILRGAVTNYYNFDPFFLQLQERMPPLFQPDLVPPAFTRAMAGYNAFGITTIYEGHGMDLSHVEAYRGMRAMDVLNLRVQVAPELEPGTLPSDRKKSPDELRATLETVLAMRTLDDDWFRIDGITACVHGPCNSGMMPWKAGYRDAWGERTTGNRWMSEENLRAAYEFCAERGLRLNVCAGSPDEHDEHIALTAEVMRKHNLDRTGWLLQHGILIREDQAQRYAELGFDMTASMSFTFGKGDMYAERIGPEVLPLLNPLRHLIDGGLTVAAGMDWGPTNPFEQMKLAVTHEMFPSGRSNAGPGQVVSRAEAFQMWTANGAKVLGWDGIGSLAPGNHADLAILDRNPITCDLDALPSTQVMRTHVGGRIVHDDGSLKAPSATAGPDA
ncbi:amidohydrolase [Streptomyces sp. NBC_00078]|uniref:amidohydrolase n=1 Tax=unclassified Streptomyces TaxID=2593676 RepID=UPI00225B4A8D|nr:amidohydrolase family protein [Streptomyces sp. NBC_00078]MCX5426046.1 amidohydrolase family protein [Streptomyces sp. NBC_00078]